MVPHYRVKHKIIDVPYFTLTCHPLNVIWMEASTMIEGKNGMDAVKKVPEGETNAPFELAPTMA